AGPVPWRSRRVSRRRVWALPSKPPKSFARSSRTFSPLWPKGGWPRSWERQAASTTSGSQPSSAPMSRPTCATSREWVSRVRTKSLEPAPSTWVFAPRRRSAEECSTRARSRWNGVRACDFGGSVAHRCRSADVYPAGGTGAVARAVASALTRSPSRGVEFGLVKAGGMVGGQLAGVHPALGDLRRLGAPGAAAGALGVLARVGAVVVELGELRIEVGQRLHGGQAVAHLAADRVPLEVPGHVLAKVADAAALVL